MRCGTMSRAGACAGAILLAVLAILASCGGGSGDDESGGPPPSTDAAPDGAEAPYGRVDSTIVLKPLSGEPVRMSELRGKIVVMSFWATWNNDSVEMLAIMDALARRYRQVRFLAVATDAEGARTVKPFVAARAIASEIYVNGAEVARSVGGVGKLPVTIVILRDGRILRRFEGLHRKDKYEAVLRGIRRRRL